MGPGYEGLTGRAPSEPSTQSLNPALERLREAGVSFPSSGLRELAESERKLAMGFGEMSNIAAEAITLLESQAVSAWLREVHGAQVAVLRERLEAACRSVS